MSSSEYYTFLGTTCDWKCHNSVENENIFSCDNVMLDYFLAWSHIFAYFNFYKTHLVMKHPVEYNVFNTFNDVVDVLSSNEIYLSSTYSSSSYNN